MIIKTTFNINDKVFVLVKVSTKQIRCKECKNITKEIRQWKVYQGIVDSVEVRRGYYRMYADREERSKTEQYHLWLSRCKLSEETEYTNDSRKEYVYYKCREDKPERLFKTRKEAQEACDKLNKGLK